MRVTIGLRSRTGVAGVLQNGSQWWGTYGIREISNFEIYRALASIQHHRQLFDLSAPRDVPLVRFSFIAREKPNYSRKKLFEKVDANVDILSPDTFICTKCPYLLTICPTRNQRSFRESSRFYQIKLCLNFLIENIVCIG